MHATSKHCGTMAVVSALALAALLAPVHGRAAEPEPVPDSLDSLDPSNYARLTWNGRELVRPPEGKVHEVVGSTGEVKIEVVGEKMKKLWDFDTQGSLSLRGWVVPAGGDRRNIEIQGFSMVGETLTVFDLNLSAAFEIVSQLLQGDRLANELLRADKEAQLAGLAARKDVLVERLAAEGKVFAETERALRAVYTEALRFTLDGRHVQDAAALIAAAEAARAGVSSPDAAARAAELASFFRHVETQRVTLEAWLGSVLSETNRPYMPILAQIAGRSEHVVRAVAEEVQKLLQRVAEGGLDEEARGAAKRRLVKLADAVRDIETDVVLHYMKASDHEILRIQNAPQFAKHAPVGSELRAIELPDDLIKSCHVDKEATAAPVPCPDCEETTLVEEIAAQRLDALKEILDALVGSARYKEVGARAKERFENQIRASLASVADIRVELHRVDGEIGAMKRENELREKAVKECMPKLKVQAETIETALMIDVIHSLIDSIDPVFVNLDRLDLSAGDQLAIDVSLKPRRSPDTPPPLQMTSTFLVVPWGWRAPAPRVKDVLTFVQPDRGGDFSPSPGVTALWNYYGKSPKKKHWLRTLAPGFGIEADFLDFDGDEGRIEVGLGIALSLFDDLIHVTYGENLQHKVDGDSRRYWGLGVSLTQVVDRFKKKEE